MKFKYFTFINVSEIQRITIPVFLHLYVPKTWDKIAVFDEIDEMKLENTIGTNIRIKAIQKDYHKMFAEIFFQLIRNANELSSGIDKIWNCEPTEVSVITPQHSNEDFDLDIPSRAGKIYIKLCIGLYNVELFGSVLIYFTISFSLNGHLY